MCSTNGVYKRRTLKATHDVRNCPTMKVLVILLLSALAGVWPLHAAVAEASGDSIEWDLLDLLLSKHVSKGVISGSPVNIVNYSNIRKDARLQVLIDQITSYPQSHLVSREEKLSFFINAYNILTIKVIVDHWPVASIRDIGNWFSNAWDIPVIEVDGQRKSLDDIEHRVLRTMGEPRIHFALNCASVSCPNLRLEAYRPDRVYSQLDDQVEEFVNQSGKGAKLQGDLLHLSKIFKWYAEDFDDVGGVLEFMRQRRPDLKFTRIKTDLDYDWDLNGG